MGSFICVAWPISAAAVVEKLASFEAELSLGGQWRPIYSAPGSKIYATLNAPAPVRTLHSGSLVIGDLFDQNGDAAPERLDLQSAKDAHQLCRTILNRYWGRYVLVVRDRDGAILGAFRDPCGAGDVAIWTCAEFTIVANALPPALFHYFAPKQGLNWRAIHALAADPLFAVPTSPFAGMTALPSGGLAVCCRGEIQLSQLWQPAAFARDCEPVSGAEVLLREQIDRCIDAYCLEGRPILAEVSGGFDSAVVASGLKRCGAPVVSWCNHYTDDPSGDERRFANAVGQMLGVEILSRARPPSQVSPELIARSQFGLRPSALALDAVYDEDTVALAGELGATRVFTGLGGDGLFFSMPMPVIAKDMLRHQGLAGFAGTELGDLARWCRKSIWSIARAGFWPARLSRAMSAPAWVRPLDRHGAQVVHPWLLNLGPLSPTKREHVEEQVLALLTSGTSRRGETLDLVNPLFSQPVLELCLRLPVDQLVQGGRDRALARRAFQSRVPTVIHARRSKGELGCYYAQGVAAGLPSLRAFLLNGRLMEQGVLEPAALIAAMDEANLAQHGRFSAILFTVAIEAWVRRWERPSLGLEG